MDNIYLRNKNNMNEDNEKINEEYIDKNNNQNIVDNSNFTNNDQEEKPTNNIKHGDIKISEFVITEIVRKASMEVEGVIGLAGDQSFMDTITEMISNTKKVNDVKITKMTNDFVEIDIRLIIQYNSDISQLAPRVQNRVSEKIKEMTGMNSKIHVTISNVEQREQSSTKLNNDENIESNNDDD